MSRLCFVLLATLPFILCKPQDGAGGSNPSKLNLDSTREASKPCTLQDGSIGECVLYFQCDESLTVIEDGSELLDLRRSVCAHYLEVCCAYSNGTNAAGAATTTPSPEMYLSLNGDGDLNPMRRPTTPFLTKSQELTGCGWSNPKIRAFKTTTKEVAENSVYANYGDFPFMVAIIKQNNISDVWSPSDFVGGGLLIHMSYVLTAAHKVTQYEASQLKCRAGEYDTQTIKEQFPHQERDVRKITVHENYFRASLYNDIALIALEAPFEPAPNIGIGCLGKTLPPDGATCFAMGWGKEFDNEYREALILKKVKLNLVSRATCERQLQNERFGPQRQAGRLKKTNGDSTRYVAYGLVAYGLQCGHKDVPGVYVNLPNMYDWINGQMDGETLEKPYIY
ncbi:phenoloxidase-activating factor 2-like [Zerene cesonia]|uniref:phenoloxidase-activating factor 2-like n=1 Tax=Zerene cesonia TaxID=33412 RepID=UPI0018E5089C|nr:phenoloxidase-activating factor 2-like [Zerene cesonia]